MGYTVLVLTANTGTFIDQLSKCTITLFIMTEYICETLATQTATDKSTETIRQMQTDRQTDRHRKIQNNKSLLTFPETIFSYIWIGWSAKKGGYPAAIS